MPKFAAQFRYLDKERRDEVRPRHREYLKGLFEQGKIVMSGPWADDSGAMAVFEVADEAEARELLAADPYNEAGVVGDLQVREWQVIFPP
ncbi:MAG: hypothetical protein GEV03_10350 [Streptosporangiales bacterium]|nr:hypothetical protein [Streptosporangiales bacterium]